MRFVGKLKKVMIVFVVVVMFSIVGLGIVGVDF